MAHIIYSKIGIIGEGSLEPAFDYVKGINTSAISSLDLEKHNVDIYDDVITLNASHPVEKDVIYCTAGYISTKSEGSLHCWNSGAFYYNKVVFDKDLSDIDRILIESNVTEDLRDSLYRLAFIGYFAAFDRYVIDSYTFFGFWKYDCRKQVFEFDQTAKLSDIRNIKTNKGFFLDFYSNLNITLDKRLIKCLDNIEQFRARRNSMVHFNGTDKDNPYRYEIISKEEMDALRQSISDFVKAFYLEMSPYAELINPFDANVQLTSF